MTEIERKLKVLVKGLDIKWIKDLRYDWTWLEIMDYNVDSMPVSRFINHLLREDLTNIQLILIRKQTFISLQFKKLAHEMSHYHVTHRKN